MVTGVGEGEHRLWSPRDSCWNPGSAVTVGVASGSRHTLVTDRASSNVHLGGGRVCCPRRENKDVQRVSGPPPQLHCTTFC